MRSVVKGAPPLDSHLEPVVFSHYQHAVSYLKDRLGRYCSYCERTVPVGLAVEHKLPKEHYPLLEVSWDNLLLACANCNSSKGQTKVLQDSVVWPDEHDTFSLISYLPGGGLAPTVGIGTDMQTRVISTLRLLGLSREPGEVTPTDHRHFDRLEVWALARQSRKDLINRDIPELRRLIVETAKAKGGYSIWQSVFNDDPSMRQALVQGFPGTKDLPALP